MVPGTLAEARNDARVTVQSGETYGIPLMKFNLSYEGPIPASANSSKKQDVWRIRKAFHPQLVDLWASHPALKTVMENRYFPKSGGATLTQNHHDHPGPIIPPAKEQLI